MLKGLLNGAINLLHQDVKSFLVVHLIKYEKREVKTPEAEVTLWAEFVEELPTNRTLIRRRLKTEELRIVFLSPSSWGLILTFQWTFIIWKALPNPISLLILRNRLASFRRNLSLIPVLSKDIRIEEILRYCQSFKILKDRTPLSAI